MSLTISPEQQRVIDEITTQLPSDEDMEKIGRYTLADAIREGSQFTEQANGWGSGEQACALHAAALSAKARGYIK